MKAACSLPLISVLMVVVFATCLILPVETSAEPVWLPLPEAETCFTCNGWGGTLVINIREDGSMADEDGVELNREILRKRLLAYAKKVELKGREPSVTIRAHRAAEVRAIRLIYDEVVAAGYRVMKLRVHRLA